MNLRLFSARIESAPPTRIFPEKSALVPVKVPVKVPPARGNLVAILFVTVVEKLASSPSAAASSFNVFNALGLESTKLEIAVSV